MEYCDRPKCAGLHGKRKMYTPGALLSATVLAAALCKLTGIKIPEPAPLPHSAYAQAVNGGQIQGQSEFSVLSHMTANQPVSFLLEPPVRLSFALTNMPFTLSVPALPDKPEPSLLLPDVLPSSLVLPDVPPSLPALPDALPTSPAPLDVPAKLNDPSHMQDAPQGQDYPGAPSIPQGQMLPGAPSITGPDVPESDGILPMPGYPVVPNIPQTPEVIEPPLETPSIPDGGSIVLPPQNILPDVPSEVVPDNPAGQEKPDASDGEKPVSDEPRGFRVDKEGMIYGYDPSAGLALEGILTLPGEGCSGIAKGAFEGAGAGIYELYIPPNITYIEPGALASLSDLGWIGLNGSNSSYESFEGILFDSALSNLVCFPAARTGQYGMPGSTARLEDYSFSGTQLSKLDMRDCGLVEVGKKAFGDTAVTKVSVAAPRQYMEEYKAAFDGSGVLVK